MFSKKEEIDEIELGANLYLKGLKESKHALATQNIMAEIPQELITPLKNHTEEIKQDLAKQNIIIKTPQEPKAPLKNPFEDILERAKKLAI